MFPWPAILPSTKCIDAYLQENEAGWLNSDLGIGGLAHEGTIEILRQQPLTPYVPALLTRLIRGSVSFIAVKSPIFDHLTQVRWFFGLSRGRWHSHFVMFDVVQRWVRQVALVSQTHDGQKYV